MKGHFFSDPNHEDKKHIEDFCNYLRAHAGALGIKKIFLEFFYQTIPDSDEAMIDDFSYCSGGRRAMQHHYIGIVKLARSMGIAVHGLALRQYYQHMRTDIEGAFVFRGMCPFDGISALILRNLAGDEPFLVFLGAGHWPLLRHFLPTLTLVGANDERVPDPWQGERAVQTERLRAMIDLADQWSQGQYSQLVMKIGVDKQVHIEKTVSELLRGRKPGVLGEMASHVNQLYQDKVGIPLTLFQLNFLYATLKNTLVLK